LKIAEILDRIQLDFPSIHWQKTKRIESGMDFQVVLLDQNYVIRVPRTPDYQEIMKNEIHFANILKNKLAIPFSYPIHLSADYTYGIYNYVAGKRLTTNLKKKDLQIIARQLAHFLKQLHALKQTRVQASHYLENSIERLLINEKSFFIDHLDADEQTVLDADLYKYKAQLKDKKPETVLVHGDLSLDNILWDRASQQTGILDFSDRDMTDPAYDFSGLFELKGDFVKAVVEEYGGSTALYQRAKFYYKMRPLMRIINKEKDETSLKAEINEFRRRKKRL